jgi:hypothetical protein
MRVASASVLWVAAVVVSLSASGRPTPYPFLSDTCGRRICPAPGPGRGVWAKMACGDARDGQIPLQAESQIREPEMNPASLAWTLLEPLEG